MLFGLSIVRLKLTYLHLRPCHPTEKSGLRFLYERFDYLYLVIQWICNSIFLTLNRLVLGGQNSSWNLNIRFYQTFWWCSGWRL